MQKQGAEELDRHLKFKDGRKINTWLLHQGEDEVQCLSAAAPIDPEVGIVSFDDEQGAPIAILWHYSLHTNANFGLRFSADYPALENAITLNRPSNRVR
jgi:hypothetical protein